MSRFARPLTVVACLSLGLVGIAQVPAVAIPGDPGQWQAMGTGMNNNVRGLAVGSNGTLYAVGDFTSVSGVSRSRIASWNDDTWSSLGSGLGNVGYSVTTAPNGTVFVSGGFTAAGGTPARGVASWDGTAWSALASGANGNISVVAAAPDDSLYVGGQFSQGGTNAASSVARWNGASYSTVGGGINSDTAYALDVSANGTLYLGGDVALVGNVAVHNIARWRDDTWNALGGGLDSEVYWLATRDNDSFYAGGYFANAGGPAQSDVAVNKVALWSDDTWSALGYGLGDTGPNYVYGVAYDDTHGMLYATGNFLYACGSAACLVTDDTVPLNNVGAWDEGAHQWRPLKAGSGLGINNDGNAVAVSPDGRTVYVGGTFASAGGVSGTAKMARWVWDTPDLTAVTPTSGPSSGGTTLTLDGRNFVGVGRVMVGNTSAPFTWLDDSTISVTTPPGTGTVDVVVDAVGGTTPTPASYTYINLDPLPVVPPGAPTSVIASAGDHSASVSWQAPASSGSYPISTYQLTASPGGASCMSSDLTCAMGGLTNGTTYTFTVQALSGAGWGAMSSPSNAVTPLAPPPSDASILITGSRSGNVVTVSGSTTGFGMGGIVTPWTKKAGSGQAYAQGREVLVDMAGEFSWSRKVTSSVWVYFTGGGVRSNYVKL